MVGVSTWFRYMRARYEYAYSATWKACLRNELDEDEVNHQIWRKFRHGRLTFVHFDKGKEMYPLFGTKGAQLLVRKIAEPDPTNIRIGDVVVHKDPEDTRNLIVRRIAALEDWEMESTDKNEQSFDLGKDEVWVLADNKSLTPKEAHDSRTFGPIYTPDIVGRAIYCLRSPVDFGPIDNSEDSTRMDSPLIEMELDLDDMIGRGKE